MDEAKVRKYVQVVRRALDLIEQELGGTTVLEPAPASPKPKESVSPKPDRKDYLDSLLNNTTWPLAVPERQIATASEADQKSRAKAVMDAMIVRSLDGLHFLDYGCGEGWVAEAAKSRGVASSTGYDIVTSPVWDKLKDKVMFTDSPDLPKNFYDVILLYDVIDHSMDAEGVMSHVYELLKPGGTVYVRCHPWISRHGAHLYKQGLNKAFIHLFLTEEELVDKGYSPLFVRHETNPLVAYKWFFDKFIIERENIIRPDSLEPFFQDQMVKNLLWAEQNIDSKRKNGFIKDLEITFCDYILMKRADG
jgi:SAM-dependent methyltransferase